MLKLHRQFLHTAKNKHGIIQNHLLYIIKAW